MLMDDLKHEWSPLLPPGLHDKTLAEVQQLCVASFPLSSTRSRLMFGLENVCMRLCSVGVKTGWMDGSFLTLKIDPQDVDIVFWAESAKYDVGGLYKDELDWAITADPYKQHGCHTFVGFVDGPLAVAEHNAWQKQFGRGRDGMRKGIVVLTF